MIEIKEDWEFNVLGIYNFKKPGRFDALFKFIKDNHDKLPGDIVESGVFRGNSLIAIGMFLKQIGSDKKVFGFDSFSGFPAIFQPQDELSQFERMSKENLIDNNHINAVRKNVEWKKSLTKEESSKDISTSGSFSNTNIELVERKIKLVGLDNIVLVKGPFSETMNSKTEIESIMAVVMDSDLYQSYLDTFKFVWPRLAYGGMVYLDEYYSLKFPGAKIASDEFLRDKNARLEMMTQQTGEFQRWYAIKEIER